MKKFTLILLAGLLCAGSVPAEEEVDWRETCGMFAGFAETIMQKRQNGVSLQLMMDAMTDANTTEPLLEEIILNAYDKPQYSSEKAKAGCVSRYRNEVYLECAKALRKK